MYTRIATKRETVNRRETIEQGTFFPQSALLQLPRQVRFHGPRRQEHPQVVLAELCHPPKQQTYHQDWMHHRR